MAARPRADSIAAWRTPAVPTELKLDNDVSRDFTVVEVITEDRPGRPLRHHAHAVQRGARHPPLEDRHRGQPRHRRLLRARQGDRRKITDPERMSGCETQASGPALPDSVDSARAHDRASRAVLILVPSSSLARCDADPPAAPPPLLEKGERLFRQGDTAGRAGRVRRGRQGRPKDARPHYLRGRGAGEEGRRRRGATAAYKQAIARKTDFAEAHNNLGALLLAARRRGRRGRRARGGGARPSPTTPRPSTTWASRATRWARSPRRSRPTRRRCASSPPTPATA